MSLFHTKITSSMMFVGCTFFGVASAQAAIDISSAPLQTGSSVPPNIMFILDDSGSMHFELLPDNIIYQSARYVFPRASNVYGPSDYNNRVPTVEDGQPYNAFARSHKTNQSYYDPSVYYQPWVKEDGSLFPNADPKCALHNPVNTTGSFNAALCRNLTVNNSNYNGSRWVRCTGKNSGCTTEHSSVTRSYWPATYFYFNGVVGNSAEEWNWDNYTKQEIKPSINSYSGHGRDGNKPDGSPNRPDCNAGVCTYEQEIQNFANWYTYYRSRILSSRAGIGRAFVNQSEKMRVGIGMLNKGSSSVDGASVRTIVRGVRDFTGHNRTNFYNDLYQRPIPAAGTPLREALDAAGQYFSRTDSRGPWGLNPGSGSEDSIDHISCRQSFTILMTDGYWTESQFTSAGNQDGSAGSTITNSDESVFFKYEPGPPFSDNRSNTLADVAMKYWKNDLRPDLDNLVPTSTVNEAFWQHMVTYGVAFGVNGDIDPADAFNAINSGANIAWPSPFGDDEAKIDDLLHAAVNSRGGFFSAAEPVSFAEQLAKTLTNILDLVGSATNLAGTTTSLQAENFVYQASFNTQEWSGDLKGYDLDNVASPVWSASFPTWESRAIYSGNFSGPAVSFQWGNLTGAQQAALNNDPQVLKYLRGDRENEPPNGSFRKRASVLGDIANSSPSYVAAPVNRNYQRHNWAGASSYNAFRDNYKDRQPMLYVGANDGMLHAFHASSTGGTVAGREAFAYVPAEALTASAGLFEYTQPDYQHRYFVDGASSAADVFIGSWRTLLISSLGRGGSSLFALDVTNPGLLNQHSILWDKYFPELGVMTQKPIVARLNNDKWGVIVGYGYNNSTDKAGLLVIDAENGNVIRSIETPDSFNTSSNGMGQLQGWDANRNGNTDLFFGGDLLGNVWKFDLSSTNPAEWGVAYGNQPLFTATDSAGNAQPITGGVSLSSQPDTGQLWVFFGTGKMLSDEDPLLSSQESWYGLMDGQVITSRAELRGRAMENVPYTGPDGDRDARKIETGSQNDLVGKRGWYIDLIDARERITSTPQLVGNSLVVNTIIPGDNDCNPQGDGWVLSINPFSGSRLNYHFFDLSGDGEFDGADGIADGSEAIPASGVKFDGMPSEPLFFEDEMAIGLANTRIDTIGVDTGARRGRISWRELTDL